ncbi:DapH/DapD/GlmU-related protein [Aeribacillus sp. FSL M8-0254]|uniref:DapH/DapD/GlmU-related protein n=1 Tax=Aeribacillus sp. FSL M8-0254 TaxID=2954577 RepID=UPI0030FBDF1E
MLISEQGHSKAKKVVLKRGCWIGANSIILPGVTVGEHSVVGAGSVVTKDVPHLILLRLVIRQG